MRCATAAVAGSPSPVTETVGKANLMPLASNAFLIIANALRRMTNCSPGKVIIFARIWTAKSPSCSTPCIFQWFEDQRCEFGILGQLHSDLFDQLTGAIEVAVVGDAHHQLVDDPVAALVLDGAQQAERHSVDWAAVMRAA